MSAMQSRHSSSDGKGKTTVTSPPPWGWLPYAMLPLKVDADQAVHKFQSRIGGFFRVKGGREALPIVLHRQYGVAAFDGKEHFGLLLAMLERIGNQLVEYERYRDALLGGEFHLVTHRIADGLFPTPFAVA